MSPTTRRVAVAWFAALLPVAALGCSGAKDAGPGSAPGTTQFAERKLTEEQRVTFSRLLQRNFEGKGAQLDVRLPTSSVSMRVEMDWTTTTGHGVIDNNGSPSEVYWTDAELLDGTVEGLTDEMKKLGRPDVRFVSRPLDPTYAIIDGVTSLLNALASEQRENPVALQDQDIAYQGTRTVDGKTLDVYRFGRRVTYLVEPDTGLLAGVDATFASFNGVVEVRIRERGDQVVRGPKTAEVVLGTEIADVYKRLTGKALPGVPGTTTPPAPGSSPS